MTNESLHLSQAAGTYTKSDQPMHPKKTRPAVCRKRAHRERGKDELCVDSHWWSKASLALRRVDVCILTGRRCVAVSSVVKAG